MNLRDYERETIASFVKLAVLTGYLKGDVLDVGSGLQPYREIVEAGSLVTTYTPFDAPGYPGSTVRDDTTGGAFGQSFDSILCTQVIQYVENPGLFLFTMRERFRRPDYLGGPMPECFLVMTYPTNWPEVEADDLHRFTKAGMTRLLVDAGFTIVEHVQRGVVHDPAFSSGRQKRITATGEDFVLGYGVVARA